MKFERFKDSPVGRVEEIEVPVDGEIVRLSTFVPDSLPAKFDLDNTAINAIIEASIQLKQLDAITEDRLPDPTFVAGFTVRREAISTSALEGTYAPVADVLLSEASPDMDRSTAITEVLNFITAANHGATRLASLPISTRMACELHGLLVANTPSDDYQRGQLRQTPVVIGRNDGSIQHARFVPPPAGNLLQSGMDDWEQWIHGRDDLNPLLKIAVSHYQFETLHPFTDGNGRIGRLLAVLQLIEAELLRAPVINLSPYFEVRRDQYFASLEEVSATGAWSQWIALFCTALASQAQESIQRIRDLLSWRDETITRLQENRVRGTAIDTVPQLIATPVVDAAAIAGKLNVSKQSAYNAIKHLVAHDVLQETTGRAYRRAYRAPAIIDILSR